MIRGLVLSGMFLLGIYANAFQAPIHPNPELTQGDFCSPQDRDFEGYRYKEKIPTCYRYVSRELKTDVYEAYGVPEKCRGQYTVDHFVPLMMGGSNQFTNLWPEHKDVKATRQNLEQELYDRLRRGTISQNEAYTIIVEAKMNPPHVNPRNCRVK